MTKYSRIAFMGSTIIMFALFIACTGNHKTYYKYNISFDYPADMEIKETGVIGFNEEASEMAGGLLITKPGILLEPGTILEVIWMGPFENADHSYIQKILGSYMAGKKTANHRYYLGDDVKSKRNGHTVLGTRFYTEGERGILLNITGSWYCDISKRVYIIRSGSRWHNPALVTDGRTMMPEWPKLKRDASYKMYENILDSFHCHL